MKRIRERNKPTPSLAEYLKVVGDNANWNDFRDHNKGASYGELIEKLIDVQRGLCGYCEINLTDLDRQIEHVIPRKDPQQGASREVDVTNMIACCKGGTSPVFASSARSSDEERYLEPVKDNMSCGQAKGDYNDADFLDPRKLPALPSLTKVLVDGRIEVDEKACESVDIPAARVIRTIEILNLNAERLRSAREKQWNNLEEEADQIGDLDDSDIIDAWIRSVLMLDDAGRLVSFFTTTRSYFGPLAERVLEQQLQEWI
ncbi:MAG: TIGR02646 family protein [Acidimicrobiia bacterium]|nr:TIGR02646 family protein [Acidimicrobiia bacterium]